MLVFLVLVLLLVEASGLPMGEHPVSLNRKAFQQFDQIIDKLNSLNLRKARNMQQKPEFNLQGAVKEFVDRAQSVMDAVKLNKRVVSKNENQPEDVIASVFDYMTFNKKDLQNAMLMKKDELSRQLGFNATKLAFPDARNLKNDLMLKRDLSHEQHLKEIEKLASNLLDLKSLHERTLNPSSKMKKNVEIRQSIDRLSNFDWFPWKQEKFQSSARDVNQRELNKENQVSHSTDVVWFPWKQEKLQNFVRDVNQREQSKDGDMSLVSDVVWFPWKQVNLQNSARDVNQRAQSQDDHVSLMSDVVWFPWKQGSLHDTVRDIKWAIKQNLLGTPSNGMRDLGSHFTWDWKKDFYKPLLPENNKRDQDSFLDF